MNTSRFLFTTLVISLLLGGKITAQPNKNDSSEPISHFCSSPQTILVMKKDFLKQNLTLSETEASKFWSTYDTYLKEEYRIHENSRKKLIEQGIEREKGKIEFGDLSDNQILFFHDQMFETKAQLLDLEKRFYFKLKTILNPKNISEFYRLEKDFKKSCFKNRKTNPMEDIEKKAPSK
ncbi:MAG: hypothetical protein RR356_02515 [Bacteroidales bacterium]